ncbi:MAG: radical SAM protein [Armatimonadetes bacterium]|nr:radical SAM protein [Armatimonadota bacterium]
MSEPAARPVTCTLVAPDSGEVLSFSRYPGAFALKVGEAEVYSFDGEGRPVGLFTGDRWLRRGLDNTLVEKRAQAFTTGWQPVAPDEADPLLDRVAARLAALHDRVRAGGFVPADASSGSPGPEAVTPYLARAAAWNSRRCHADAARFRQIYRRVPILPPDQYLSVVLQPTEGCRYNRCTFCTLYRDRPFRVKSPEEFRRHLVAVRAFFGRGLARRRSLFLGDANALTLPAEALVTIFEAVQEAFAVAPGALSLAEARRWQSAGSPRFEGIYSFLDVFTGCRKSAAEYAALRERGLRRVYLGLESGHAPLLAFLRKPERVGAAVALVQTLHQAGLSVGVIVMVGVGGQRYAAGHVRDTVAALNAMALRADDLVYLSEFVEHPDSDYAAQARAEGVLPLDADALAAQAEAIRTSLRFPGPPPRLSVYRLREFVY